MKPAKLYLITVIALAMFSCSKDPTPELIQGKWIIKTVSLAGDVFTDGKSSLDFHSCSDTLCTGVDYDSDDQTTGYFTWSLDEETDLLTIVDTLSEGGGYNAEWLVESVTAKRLKISANSGIFGVMIINLKKD